MDNLMEKIVSLCKRRGFVFPSSEIYGGFASCYDFGPLGVEMKNNIKKSWWDEMLKKHENIVGLDAAILMKPEVWQASGHLTAGFADELVECKSCHKRFRTDEVQKNKCLECGGELIAPRKFNLMMKTFVGPVEDEAAVAYLRAETCQGIYMNYENVLNSMRVKIPFGIAQIGKAFRNEITPKDFIYRTREFEQMEMQWFCRPSASTRNRCGTKRRTDAEEKENWTPDDWFEYWKDERLKWYYNLGIKKENLRITEHKKEELSHYAKAGVDIEYHFPFGWKEIEGIHNRGDWDLSNHSKHSGKDLSYFNEDTKEPSSAKASAGKKYFPYIIETSGGADRSFFASLCESYHEDKDRIVLKLKPKLAPYKAAVFPLLANKPELVKLARKIYENLRKEIFVAWDDRGNIGKRYYSQDEIGTPFCITVDFESLEKDDVTVRSRDTMKQERVKIANLHEYITNLLESD